MAWFLGIVWSGCGHYCWVRPGRSRLCHTVLLGIAGALLGGFIGRAMGFYGQTQTAGWLMSIAGAVLLLALHRLIVGRRI